MKTIAKRILSLAIVVCMAFIGVFVTPVVKADAATNYVETSFGEGKLLITTEDTKGNKYYLPAATSTSAGPAKKTFTDVSEISEDNLWTVTATTGGYYIQNSSGNYLNNIKDNNGVRVSGTKASWTYGTDNSLKDNTNNRFLGVYVSGSNWRCYTSVTQSNYSGTSKNFKFYAVDTAAAEKPTTIDDVNSYISLSYQYSATSTEAQGNAFKKVTAAMADWSGEYLIVYETGKVAFNGALATLDAVSNTVAVTISNGEIEATEAMKAATFTVEKSGDNYTIKSKSGKYIGRNSASNGLDSSSSELSNTISFENGKVVVKGTEGYSLQYNKSNGQTRFRYFGTTQESIALYKLETAVTTINGVSGEFRIRCAVDSSLAKVEGVEDGSYGIQVTANGNTVNYNKNNSVSWTESEEDELFYVVIDLGDILNDKTKLNTEFTVAAYTENGRTVSANAKTYSVLSMIKSYYDVAQTKGIVSELYNYWVELGFYGEVA